MKNKIMFWIFVISLLLLVGCSTINSESQAIAKAEKYAENLWVKAQTDPRNCIEPPCEVKEHWARTKGAIQKEDYWIVTVEITAYDPKSEMKAKLEDDPLIKKVLEAIVYLKTNFYVKVTKSGEVSCLQVTYPYNLITPCEVGEK